MAKCRIRLAPVPRLTRKHQTQVLSLEDKCGSFFILQKQDHIKTVLVCRVKRRVKQRECLENIVELGHVLKILTIPK